MAQNLLESIMSAQGGGLLDSLGGQFGLDRNQTESAVRELLPALSSGLKRQAATGDGLKALAAAVDRDGHDRYLDDAELLKSEQATLEGNGILGHLLGSKDASRAVADRASAETGLSSGLLKQLLPVLASMAMGAISKNMRGGQGASGGGILGDLLGGVLGGGGQSGGGGGLGDLVGGLLGGARGGGSGGGGGLADLGDLGRMFDADDQGRNADDLLESFFNQRR